MSELLYLHDAETFLAGRLCVRRAVAATLLASSGIQPIRLPGRPHLVHKADVIAYADQLAIQAATLHKTGATE